MIVAKRSLLGITRERASLWVKTAAVWGGCGVVVLLYLTDWKVVMGKVPFVRNRFKED